MVAMLQPRPKQSPSAAPVKGGRRQREWTPPPLRGEPKGTGKELRRRRQGEGKKQVGESWEKSWFSEKTAPDGQTRPICMRHNLSQCTVPKCTFAHCCPVQCAAPQTRKSIACPHRSFKVSTWEQLPAYEMATSVGRPLPEPHHDSGIAEYSRQISDPDWNGHHRCR